MAPMRTSGRWIPQPLQPHQCVGGRAVEVEQSRGSRGASGNRPSSPPKHKHAEDTHGHALEEGGPCAPDQCHLEHDQRDAVVGRCRRVSGHRARMCPGLTAAAAVGVALRHRNDRSSVGPATAMGRQRQFGRSNCRRTARIRRRQAGPALERPLWRMSTFEWSSAYGGSTLEPVVDGAVFLIDERPELAGTASSPPSPAAVLRLDRRSDQWQLSANSANG